MACYTAFREQDSDEVHIDITEHFDQSRYEDLRYMFHVKFVYQLIDQLKSNKVHAVEVHIDNTSLILPIWTGILIHQLLDAEVGIVITNE